jgi:protein arginine N-methyltransferase 5
MFDTMEPTRPYFHLGEHSSKRELPLTDLQYGHLLNQGINFVTTPITNSHFKDRIFELVASHLSLLAKDGEPAKSTITAGRPDPIIPPLTPEDTGLFPSAAVNTYTAYISPWIDLSSANPVVASISRQVLNLEVNYANFCGVKNIVIPGPAQDASKGNGNLGLAQYSRAVQEAMTVGSRLTFLVHMPMYREPLPESSVKNISSLVNDKTSEDQKSEVDLFTSWDSWHHIRTVCEYSPRLFVGM